MSRLASRTVRGLPRLKGRLLSVSQPSVDNGGHNDAREWTGRVTRSGTAGPSARDVFKCGSVALPNRYALLSSRVLKQPT